MFNNSDLSDNEELISELETLINNSMISNSMNSDLKQINLVNPEKKSTLHSQKKIRSRPPEHLASHAKIHSREFFDVSVDDDTRTYSNDQFNSYSDHENEDPSKDHCVDPNNDYSEDPNNDYSEDPNNNHSLVNIVLSQSPSKNLMSSIMITTNNNVWIDDNTVNGCYTCKRKFSFILRKHHCRYCGNIFCGYCSSKTTVIPNFIKDKPDSNDTWNITHYLVSLKDQEERVCDKCYKIIEQKTKLHNTIMKMLNTLVDIDDFSNIKHEFYKTRHYYFEYMHNIQYYQPNYIYSSSDKNILLSNYKNIITHSKYLLHYIKALNWDHLTMECLSEFENNEKDIIFALSAGAKHRRKSCKELYCTRTCSHQLSIDDAFSILYSLYDYLPESVLELLFKIIFKASSHETLFLCYFPLLTYLISHSSLNSEIISDLIIKIIEKRLKYQYNIYWLLMTLQEGLYVGTSDEENERINRFILKMNQSLVKIMHKEYVFYSGLMRDLDNTKRYFKNNFDKVKPLSLPYDPETKIIGIDFSSIVRGDSYTKPVFISVHTKNSQGISETKRLLFKNESVMNDLIVLNLITIYDHLLKKHVDRNFDTTIYKVMPLSSNSGMIEIVTSAETIQKIRCSPDGQTTILEYIVKNNPDEIIRTVLDRYTYSFASYTVNGYFLGIGDRHLENIMITTDGKIFHIDFGFVMGKESQPITMSDIRIIPDMIKALGGPTSERYLKYKKLCADSVIVLRKYSNILFLLLAQLESKNMNIDKIEKFINKRCQHRQSDDVIVEEISDIIEKSHDAIIDSLRDVLHYHTKEKTFTNNLSYLVNKSYDIYKSFTKGTNDE
jgi:hypothetical protein